MKVGGRTRFAENRRGVAVGQSTNHPLIIPPSASDGHAVMAGRILQAVSLTAAKSGIILGIFGHTSKGISTTFGKIDSDFLGADFLTIFERR